jgi:hypothetical protein
MPFSSSQHADEVVSLADGKRCRHDIPQTLVTQVRHELFVTGYTTFSLLPDHAVAPSAVESLIKHVVEHPLTDKEAGPDGEASVVDGRR